MMDTQLRRMTLKQLDPIVRDYQSELPGWALVQRDTLVRASGPILQGVVFERLSSGVYRPMGYTRVLTAPGGGILTQFLKPPVQNITPADHERKRERVVQAMRREFVPRITDPLNPMKVLKLCEREAAPTAPQAYALASLNAYLGKTKRALYWSSRFSKLVDELGRPWENWDRERRAFLDELEKWIGEGTEIQHLEEVLCKEKEKCGL